MRKSNFLMLIFLFTFAISAYQMPAFAAGDEGPEEGGGEVEPPAAAPESIGVSSVAVQSFEMGDMAEKISLSPELEDSQKTVSDKKSSDVSQGDGTENVDYQNYLSGALASLKN